MENVCLGSKSGGLRWVRDFGVLNGEAVDEYLGLLASPSSTIILIMINTLSIEYLIAAESISMKIDSVYKDQLESVYYKIQICIDSDI